MSTPISIISDAWYEALVLHPEWRRGQALFNVVWEYDENLGRELFSTDYANPYYDDVQIGSALSWLTERLGY
jgi:hypothetical protein